MTYLERMATRLDDMDETVVPEIGSFVEFLEQHAKVRLPGGRYVPYSFEGRKPLRVIAEYIDLVLGSETGEPIQDARLDICGGAQFGKTIIALLFVVYLTCVRFRNAGYYLPDDDLVQGIVDAKFRPEVVEQIPWVNELMQLGKTRSESGKTVNRKGAFMTTDGERIAMGMIRGMGKIPTSFSMDVAMEDEKDDIPPNTSKYLTGRMSSSDLRFVLSIGTQRYAGAGQNKQWLDGSQGLFVFDVPGRQIAIEEEWPEVCRLQLGEAPSPSDPKLSATGDFVADDETVYPYKKGQQTYYYADPVSGVPVKHAEPVEIHRKPERLASWDISLRISQMALSAMSINQVVSRWQAAVKDAESMVVFRCEVMADPSSTSQELSPEVLTRARDLDPYEMSMAQERGALRYAGVDTGNRCWLMAREVEAPDRKRVQWAEQIPSGDVVKRTVALFHTLGLSAVFVDAHPLLNEARSLCYELHGLTDIEWPQIDDPQNESIYLPGGLTWLHKEKRWQGLKCAAVRFGRKPGAGIVQLIEVEETTAGKRYYPVISCNRQELIERAVHELLTPKENVTQVIEKVVNGEEIKMVRDYPAMALPSIGPGAPAIVEEMSRQFLTGSKRETGKDGESAGYVDNCENHLLLCNGYSALAEMLAGSLASAVMAYQPTELHYRTGSRRAMKTEVGF